jgi:serine/threonine protein kinase
MKDDAKHAEKTAPFDQEGLAGSNEVSSLLHTVVNPRLSQATLERLKPLSGRYDLLGELGRGGMGAVYKARDRETGDIVALKVVLPEVADDRFIMERFTSELLLARKVTHKNVCRMFDFARFDNVTAISMEYVEGQSLRSILQRGQVPPLGVVIDWAKQICSALAEAHSQGVIHRDLKPENILVTAGGTVKVMDFGIARSVQDLSQHTQVIGTPTYMSPEQAQGRASDQRSDIYSFGVLLYEILMGSVPQVGVPEEGVESLVARQSSIPTSIMNIVTKCLQRKPANRFQSVIELMEALKGGTESRSFSVVGIEEVFSWGWNMQALLEALIGLDYQTIDRLTPEHEGEAHLWAPVFGDHPESWKLLIRGPKDIVGYWHFVSLFDDDFERAKQGNLLDSEITTDRVRLFELPGWYNIYVVSICILPQYRKTALIRSLFRSMLETFAEMARNGVFVQEICANAYSPSGVSLCKSLGLSHCRPHDHFGEIYVGSFRGLLEGTLFDWFPELRALYRK